MSEPRVRTLRLVCWLALVGLTAGAWAASDRTLRAARTTSAVAIRADVAYRDADGRRLALDVYLPPAGAPRPSSGPGRPAILAIHGGSWVGGSRRLFRPDPGPWDPRPSMAVQLAEAGFVVVAPDYRMARPGSPAWPGARDDLREAVRWIRRHARELEVDPGRIAALGLSAGGHLAAVLGTAPGLGVDDDADARVAAVIDFYGPSDLEDLPGQRVRRLAHEPVRLFLGDGPARDASPARHVGPGAVPMLLIHGTDDGWVPIAQSEELAGALRAAGVPHRLIRIEGARHGFGLEVNDPGVKIGKLLPEILAFLQSCAMLQAESKPAPG